MAAIVLLIGLALVLDLRHALSASLPPLDGNLHIAGLQAPVSVTRDARGVPSINAMNLNDLLLAQGYITASDRLWQMDGLRRHAAGELAEILGSSMVEHDRRQRVLQLRATADRAVANLPADQLQQLEAYARGVNAYLESHPGSLPVEFHLLAYKPAPWTPRDSLLVSLAMWEELSTEFPQKLDREALSAHLPSDLLADLYPVGSWRDHPPSNQGRSLTAPHLVEQIPLDPSQAEWHGGEWSNRPAELLALRAALGADRLCTACRAGSNNWAVSGAHTASGLPLLSNDMHLNLQAPDLWYEAGLHAPVAESTAGSNESDPVTPGTHLDVTGFTLPGVPFVVVGRNARVAWGVTNLGADVQDLRIEHLRGSGEGTEYERPDGSWAAVAHHPERIRVRGGLDVTVDVQTTAHAVGGNTMETPIVSSLLPSEMRALSLAWTMYEPGAVNSPLLQANLAADGPSLVQAMAQLHGPSLNLVWADADGHIGYHALGLIPVRGPAVQRPRVVPAAPPPATLPGSAPPETDEDATPAEPTATLLPPASPHLLLAGFRPVRRRRLVWPQAERRAAPVRSRRLRSRTAAAAAPAEAPLPPAPAVRNYTVGSPISPVPVDALDATQAWSGYIAYDDLPAVTDPGAGFVATANSRITPDDYPWFVANDWPDAFRTDRIVHQLSGHNGLTADDMLRLQTDVHSDADQAMAQRLAYALDHASPAALHADPKRLKEAADLLRDWDGNMRTDSAGAAVLRTLRDALWPALLVPQIMAHDGKGTETRQAARIAQLYTWSEATSALELLVQNQPTRWLPQGNANWNDFLTAVTEKALRSAGAPSNLSRWQYGQIHTVEIAHPIFGEHPVFAELLGIAGSTGRQPAPGDGTTVAQIGAHFGPSERFTADLSSTSTANGNVTTGESGNPRSPWFLDQFHAWLGGSTYPMANGDPAVIHTLRLLP